MKKVRVSSKGRKCKFPQCKHILSIYNHDDYCHLHHDQADKAKELVKSFK